MLKRTFKYINFNDIEVEETCYFDLSQSELIQLNLSEYGGLDVILDTIIKTVDTVELGKRLRQIILLSYGEKSADGKHFMKSKELSDAFACTKVFDMLYVEVVNNAEKAAEFVNAVVPVIAEPTALANAQS